MSRSLTSQPSLQHLRKEAKALLRAHRSQDAQTCESLRLLRRFHNASDPTILSATVALHEVQFALAMDYGFETWASLKAHVGGLASHRSTKPDYEHLSIHGDVHSRDSASMAIQAAAELLGRKLDYDGLHAVSSNAFCPGFCTEEDCYAWWTMAGRDRAFDLVSDWAGLHLRRVQVPEMAGDWQDEEACLAYRKAWAPPIRQAMDSGEVIIIEGGWHWQKCDPWLPWAAWGIITHADDDGCITGASVNGRSDNPMNLPFPSCWAISLRDAPRDGHDIDLEVLDRAIARIRADRDPFVTDNVIYGLPAMDLWISRFREDPFCKPCGEKSWSCASSTVHVAHSGAASAASYLRACANGFALSSKPLVKRAADNFTTISEALEPFVTREEGKGYRAFMNDEAKQAEHIEQVLGPCKQRLAGAADAMEQAIDLDMA